MNKNFFDNDNIIDIMDNTDVNDTVPWIEKYRPDKLSDVMSQNNIIHSFNNFIKNKKLQHLLLYGPPGTGKTSTILAYAKELYGNNYPYMVIELNASDDRGIEVVREKIKKFVSTRNMLFNNNVQERNKDFKLVILDETDAMTSDAQAILRKVVEEYTNNARFCLICNYIQKIIPALQSRCVPLKFNKLSDACIRKKISYICEQENVEIKKTGIDTIIYLSKGDMRKVINILQSSFLSFKDVNHRGICISLGYPQKIHIKQIYTALISASLYETVDKVSKIMIMNGLSLYDIITEIYEIVYSQLIDKKTIYPVMEQLSEQQTCYLLDKIRYVHINMYASDNISIQLGALASLFVKAKKLI